METHASKHKKARTIEEFVREYSAPFSILALGAIVALTVYTGPVGNAQSASVNDDALLEAVLPSAGVTLPITWGDLGAELVAMGVIDMGKLTDLYASRGGFPDEYRALVEEGANDAIVMTRENSGYLLNLLWALGLANRNPILLDESEMMNPAYGGAGNFAATGGWTLAQGDPMDHYNMHILIPLTAEQQALVDRVSRSIFRPCCGNSAHFPDCNHGMAMLALLELMASQGARETDMYKTALAANSYWFPETYLTIATYKQQQGVEWKDVSPKEVLDAPYSSASGYQNISSQVILPVGAQRGAGCSA